MVKFKIVANLLYICILILTWFPPLFGLINTSTGEILVVGMDLITNAFDSFSFVFFFETSFFRGVFRNDDLKLPLRGSLSIHDGGTMMFECSPVCVYISKFVFSCRYSIKENDKRFERNEWRYFHKQQFIIHHKIKSDKTNLWNVELMVTHSKRIFTEKSIIHENWAHDTER